MSDTTLQHLFRSLEHTIRERIDGIQEVIQMVRKPAEPLRQEPLRQDMSYNSLLQRIQTLEISNQTLLSITNQLNSEVKSLREGISSRNEVLPLHPIDGIEVIPKREVVIQDGAEPLSYADRLLLNRRARKALEAEEMGETGDSRLLKVEEEVEDITAMLRRLGRSYRSR